MKRFFHFNHSINNSFGFVFFCWSMKEMDRLTSTSVAPEFFAVTGFILMNNSVGPFEDILGGEIILLKFDHFRSVEL